MGKALKHFLVLFVALVVCGCSNEDEPKSGNSSFSINDEMIETKDILYTLCEYNPLLKETVFEAHFKYNDDTYSFDIALPSVKAIDDLGIGDEFDADEFIINKFYSMYGSFIGNKDYEPISGTVEVKSISAKVIVMKFSNFKFRRELGSKEDIFTINGSISYSINN